jgi:tRNA(Arg) A34 adenosine deaminase TadA
MVAEGRPSSFVLQNYRFSRKSTVENCYVCTYAIYASKYVRIIVIHTHINRFMAQKSEGIAGVCIKGCQN